MNLVPHAIFQKSHRPTQHGLKRLHHWPKRVLGVSLPIGSPEMRQEDQRLGVVLEEFLDGWDGA